MASSPRRAFLRVVCCLLSSSAASAPALSDTPAAVATRPDPFVTLQALNAGRIASTWSSLPSGEGCADGRRGMAAHALLLSESSRFVQDVQPGLFNLVDTRHRVQLDGSARVGCVHAQLALQRQAAAAGDFWSWDGSALSWRIDPHWRVGAGRIARHWGPAWDGSLILDTAARPFPSVALDAASGAIAGDSFWWWLGEVDFSAFFGQLDADRADYARPYLMGMRLVVRPWRWLELGVSRTATWGGKNRDTSLNSFLTALIGRDNQTSGNGIDDQPGNQLGGFDLRADLSAWLPGMGLYGQMIGEDEAANLPSKYMHLAGADWRHAQGMLFVEWTDSTAKLPGVAYNHHIYTDGYRYHGRPLGYWGDGDANVWSAGGLWRDLLGGQALAVLRHGTLNRFGASPTWPEARFTGASLQWRTVLDRRFGLTLVLDHAALSPLGAVGGATQRDTQVRVQFDAWFD